MYDLPKTVDLGGKAFRIRYDFRAILDIICALNDPDLNETEKAIVALKIFYIDWEDIEDMQEALNKCFDFIDAEEKDAPKKCNSAKLVDWEKDAPRIIPPINRILGYETRAVDYDWTNNTGGVHWYTFLGAYMEIGDCLFAQIVRIRDKINRGKKLEKEEREWFNRNRHMVEIREKMSQEEDEFLESIFGK